MIEEHCIVCLDKYEGSKEEHLENCRRFVIITTDIPPKDREISRLYLMDMEHIEFSYCDCISYDRNGNPNCGIHKGRLQEFYDKSKVLYRSLRQPKQQVSYHLQKNGRPYCNTRKVEEQVWLETEEYITCKNCLRSEKLSRDREMIEAQKNFKWEKNKSFYYTFGELELGSKEVGKVKDLE